jgi:pyruvate,water dikinase
VPAWLEIAIATAYGDLEDDDGPALVAVWASFAGTEEMFLNVRGASNVVDAVRCCWALLLEERTVFSCTKRGFSQADLSIAVIVQRVLARDPD